MKVSLTVLLVISLVVCSAAVEIADALSYPPPPHHLASPPLKAPPPPKVSPPVAAPPAVPGYCVPKCKHRCSRNPRELCKKLCIKCCAKCKCVPTGPYGDKKECPCYRDWFNKAGKPKCP